MADMKTPDDLCVGLECLGPCQTLHAAAMSAIMTDLVMRSKHGDHDASKTERDAAWQRWVDFQMHHCPNGVCTSGIPQPQPRDEVTGEAL